MKYIFFLLILISQILNSKTYVYDMHFPQQEPPWYFSANSISDDKKGNICITPGLEVFNLSQQGEINKVIKILDPEYGMVGIHSISIDEEGNIYGLALAYKSYQIIKADPKGKIIKRGETEILDIMYSKGYIYGIGVNNVLEMKRCIIVWDKDLKRVKEFEAIATSIWVSSSKIYTGYYYTSGKITIYSLDGEKLKELDLGKNGGMGVIVDDSGYIYTKGYYPPYINKFDENGNHIKAWGYYGSEPGNFIGLGEMHYFNGKIYISDPFLGRIQIFSTEGNLLGIWTAFGKEPGKFLWPKKIDVSNNEKIFVADTKNKRVQIFNKKGELEMIIGGEDKPYFQKPSTLAVDDEGNLFVGDSDTERIYKFDKKGNLLTSWSIKDPGNYYIQSLQDIAVDKDGYVYVQDGSNDYIVKFTNNGQFNKGIYYNLNCTGFSFDLDNQKNILIPCDNSVYIFDQDGNLSKKLTINNEGYNFLDIDISNDNKIFLRNSSGLKEGVVEIDYEGNIISEFGNLSDLIKRLMPVSISLAPDGSVYILEPWRVVRYKPKPGLSTTIPASASKIGANNTYWRTDLSIFNSSDGEISVDLNYFNSFENKTINLNLNPNQLLNLKDVISNYFNMEGTFGAITSICLNETQPILFSRTYTYGSGTYGQGIRASPYEDTFYQGEKAYLIGLKKNQDFRTNLGFFNLKEFPIEINLKLLNEKGEEITNQKYELEGFGHLQINNIFTNLNIEELDGAYGIIWTDTKDGRFIAYGSIVDNYTGDPVYIEGEGYGSYDANNFIKIIPVVASKEGGYGTNWKTEVYLANLSAEAQDIELIYHPSVGIENLDVAESFSLREERLNLSLDAGEVKHFKDILTELFSFPESIGWFNFKGKDLYRAKERKSRRAEVCRV